MSSQTKKVIKATKTNAANVAREAKGTAKRYVKKVQTAAKKGVAAAKTKAEAAAKKVAVKAKTQKKKAVGFVQNVKDGIHTGMEAVGDLLKKITPDALLPNAAKSK